MPAPQALARLGARRPGLLNCGFMSGNASAGLRPLLGGLRLASLSVLHPDPWFKARQHKRRVLSVGLLRDVAPLLPPGAAVWVQTDVAALHASVAAAAAAAVPLYELLDVCGGGGGGAGEAWALPPSDRERAVRAAGGELFRTLLSRTHAPADAGGTNEVA